jgi:chemotaxis protein methyltransferase CheR
MLELTSSQTNSKSRQQLERKLFLDAVMLRYGYDFSQYADNMLIRRLEIFKSHFHTEHLTDIIPKIIDDHKILQQLINTLSISVTEFFRDPKFYREFKLKVVPTLATYPYISVWCAGCATGEEAYSWAILLDECNLLNRAMIYATDINKDVISRAKKGIYDLKIYESAAYNYSESGGDRSFDDYCHKTSSQFVMSPRLSKKICFTSHNLVHDGIFAEISVVSCRNVLIYFEHELKNKILSLFSGSLMDRGYFCTGESESLRTVDSLNDFELISSQHNIYRKSNESDYL